MRVLLRFGIMFSLSILLSTHAQEQSLVPTTSALVPAQNTGATNAVSVSQTTSAVSAVNAQPVKTPIAIPAPTSAGQSPNIQTQPSVANVQPAQTQAAQQAKTPEPLQAAVTQPDAESQEIKGIDTADLQEPQGNWLFKRIWWQKGQAQYEKIKAVVQAIMDSRIDFFKKRTEWDKTIFDPFYMDAGLGRGVLEELTTSLIAKISQERAKEGDLDENERALLQALTKEKESLEQLQKDIQKINEIDQAVDEAITVLINQINRARGYENAAWQNFKSIAQEINDKKARELFYAMVTQWQNCNEIADYIHTGYAQYFDQLGVLAQEQIKKVTDSLIALKEKGIDFKKQWQILEEKNINHHDENDAEKIAQEEAENARNQRGFIARIFYGIGNFFSGIWYGIKTSIGFVWGATFGRMFSSSESEHEQMPEIPQEPNQQQDGSSDQQENTSQEATSNRSSQDGQQSSDSAQLKPAAANQE